jgi:hypothetical protein
MTRGNVRERHIISTAREEGSPSSSLLESETIVSYFSQVWSIFSCFNTIPWYNIVSLIFVEMSAWTIVLIWCSCGLSKSKIDWLCEKRSPVRLKILVGEFNYSLGKRVIIMSIITIEVWDLWVMFVERKSFKILWILTVLIDHLNYWESKSIQMTVSDSSSWSLGKGEVQFGVMRCWLFSSGYLKRRE